MLNNKTENKTEKKMAGGPATLQIKVFLILSALLIAFGTLFYTNDLVNSLQEREKQIVELFAEGIKQAANSETGEEITFLFDNIIKPIDFPLILTDANDRVNVHNPLDIKNIELDEKLTPAEKEQELNKIIHEMDALHEPIVVTYQDTIILQKIHYGESNLISRLKFYPYLQIIIAALFILIGYIGFSNIKRSEQSNIWVGMAKETAHQFGTPISSLMGWLEMLKISYKEPDKVLDITSEIENDVEKLSKITYRFSKIGALPELKNKNVYEEIEKVINYFNKRLPQSGRVVDLVIEGDQDAETKLNGELFEWVIENLTKNALDALENNTGTIKYFIKDYNDRVEIEVADSGKGIEMKRRKDVFRPGYSTKRRGWGLGLSLSKRIIEGYHKGKIFVKHSIIGEGTTFKIILPKD